MKNILIIISALLVSAFVAKAESTFASVQMQVVGNAYWKNAAEQQALAAARAQMEQKLKIVQQEGQSLMNERKELMESLDNPAFTDERKKEIEENVKSLEERIVGKQQEGRRAQLEFQARVQRTEQEILGDIKRAIEVKAKEKGIDMVFDGGIVPYSTADLTEEVITELNKTAPKTQDAAQ